MSCATIRLSATSPNAPGVAAAPATTQSLAGYTSMRIEAELAGATGGTLDVYLQVSYDSGQTWSDYAHFAQLAAGAAPVTYGVSVSRSNGSALGLVGKNQSPLLAANTCRDGEWGKHARMLFVAGAGTTQGAAQVIRLFLSK